MKRKEHPRSLRLLPLALLFAAPCLSAQDVATLSSPQPGGWEQRAKLMMQTGNYQGAADQLRRLEQLPMLEREPALTFMLAKALFEQNDPECLTALDDFLRRYPSSPYALDAQLMVGDYNFYNGRWGAALEQYQSVGLGSLSGSQKELYSYRTALCQIKIGDFAPASRLLQGLQSKPDYFTASRFYLAYIDYAEGRLDKTYTDFAALQKILPFRKSNPLDPTALEAGYYMAQIDFQRGNYDKALQEAQRLLTAYPSSEFAPEMKRLIGESRFKQGDHDGAYPLLREYVAEIDSPQPSAVYALAVTEYERGDNDQAANRFGELSERRDAIGQSSSLYLGQIAVANGDDNTAAMAFSRAATLGFDPSVSETALYNYIAASTRGGKVPFSSSIDMLQDFLQRYPNSQYGPAVQESLAAAFYNERDYAKALRAINSIPRPSDNVLAAKQKVLYQLGAEQLANGNSKEAADYLRQAIELRRYDSKLADQAQLWLGDALYRNGDYKGAVSAFQTFIKSSRSSENKTLAIYNLAYAQYMQGGYKTAAKTFDEALKARPALSKSLADDARIRRADCLYYTGSYATALKEFNQAIADKAAASDYAAFRRALVLGLTDGQNAKINALKSFPAGYPDSRWISDAQLELADALQAAGRVSEAREALDNLSSSQSDSPQTRRALLQMAILDAKSGDLAGAEKAYKEIISRWPSSEEASLANDDLRGLMSKQGRIDEYAAFLRSVPGAPQLDEDEMDKLTFDAAETLWASDITATSRLADYIKSYPNGRYVAQALLDLSESADDAGNYEQALAYLDRLLNERPSSAQVPLALLRKAELLEDAFDDRKPEALAAYRSLEQLGGADFAPDAWAGIMRTSDNPQEVLAYARRVEQAGGLPSEQLEEARLFEAMALLDLAQGAAAEPILQELAQNPSSEFGARAAVALGQYYLDNGQLDKAEETLNQLIDNGTPHQYWLARGFIALADVYHKRGKDYVAAEYLRSLSQNYPGTETDIRNMINQRLNQWKQ